VTIPEQSDREETGPIQSSALKPTSHKHNLTQVEEEFSTHASKITKKQLGNPELLVSDLPSDAEDKQTLRAHHSIMKS